MSNSYKVCIIGPSIGANYAGGVATHVKSLKKLHCLQDADVIDPGSVHCNVRTGLFSVLKNIVALRSAVRSAGYYHVLVNASIGPTSFVKLLCILATLPAVKGELHVFFHGGRFPSLSPLATAAARAGFAPLMKKVTCFHLLSRVQLDGFRKIFSNRDAALFANYANSNMTLARPGRDFRGPLKLLFVGRIVREKGIFEALAAIREVAGGVAVHLEIVGDGPDMEEVRRFSETLLPGVVSLKGYLSGSDLEDAYCRADALLLPSYHEAFPYVFIEAMRAGLPVVCTSTGALETLVIDGENGYHVATRDVASLVKIIVKLAADGEGLQRMSERCFRFFVDNLSKSAAEEYYSTLLRGKGHDGRVAACSA